MSSKNCVNVIRDTDGDTWPVYCTAIGRSSGDLVKFCMPWTRKTFMLHVNWGSLIQARNFCAVFILMAWSQCPMRALLKLFLLLSTWDINEELNVCMKWRLMLDSKIPNASSVTQRNGAFYRKQLSVPEHHLRIHVMVSARSRKLRK